MLMLLGATLFFQVSINYMGNNISDFENVALPPKKTPHYQTRNPIIKIDATSKENWTLVDFESGQTHQITDPDKEQTLLQRLKWDLGFQRTKIISNGGATNPKGNVGLLDLGLVEFDSIKTAPQEGYTQDQRRWGKILNTAISNWYNYRTRTHNIESKKNTYLLRTSGHMYAKLKILNYYCAREETDCATVMCRRDEAACITIEYVIQTNGESYFSNNSSPPNQAALH